MKANDNIHLLRLLAQQGAGFDIVSGGELARALAAGGSAADIVFSGVGKRQDEIDAALQAGIGCFNVESEQELERIAARAAHGGAGGVPAPVSLRLTLDIDGNTHKHLTTGRLGNKFGVSKEDGLRLAKQAAASPHLDFCGYSCHIGSQIADENIYLQLAEAMADCVAQAQAAGLEVRRIDMGGGFAVAENAAPPSLSRYDALLAEKFPDQQLLIEPGRAMVAAAGALLATVEYVKHSGEKTIWVLDTGMSDLLRPALYDAAHPVVSLRAGAEQARGDRASGDIVGPICESADIIRRDTAFSAAAGDRVAILNAGAYGMVMASNYNARPRPPEVLVDGDQARLIRRRETVADMMGLEQLTVDSDSDRIQNEE